MTVERELNMMRQNSVIMLACLVALSASGMSAMASVTAQMAVAGRPGGWVDTGVDLLASDTVTISAEGSIRFDTAGRRANPDGLPDGDMAPGAMYLLVPHLRPHTLVGRIGHDGSLYDLEGFLVGSHYEATVQVAGRLFLGFNDGYVRPDRNGLTSGGVGDNSGSYTVTVTRRPSGRSRIVFASDRDGDDEIYTMDPDGLNVVQLTHNTTPDTFPSWSPDGSQIVYAAADASGNSEVFVIGADGSDPRNLTRSPASRDFVPSWSPDGSLIAFNRVRE